jgi:hypothetical protein
MFLPQSKNPSFTPIENTSQNNSFVYFNLKIFESQTWRQQILDWMIADITWVLSSLNFFMNVISILYVYPHKREHLFWSTSSNCRVLLACRHSHSCAVHCIQLKPFHYWQANLATEQDQLPRYYYIRVQHILTADITEVVTTPDMTTAQQTTRSFNVFPHSVH